MKRQIRRNVFETNSSSTHSLSIVKNYKDYHDSNSLKIFLNENNKVAVGFGEFGWEYACYNDPYTKLQYLITMLAELSYNEKFSSTDDFLNLEDFKFINDSIANYCKCDGIEIVGKMEINEYGYFSIDGYIDHQSWESYSSIHDFLNDYGITIIDFIFNDAVELITDNDNH